MPIYMNGQEYQDGVQYEIATNPYIPEKLRRDLAEISDNAKSGDFQSRFLASNVNNTSGINPEELTSAGMALEASRKPADALKSKSGTPLPNTKIDAVRAPYGVMADIEIPEGSLQGQGFGRPEAKPEGSSPVVFKTANPLTDITEADLNTGIEAGLAVSGGGLTFAGVGSKLSKQQLLELSYAKALEKKGISPEVIWQEFGWVRGPDNRWRHEIDDSTARFKDYWYEDYNFIKAKPPSRQEMEDAVRDMARKQYKERGDRFATPEEFQAYMDDPLAMADVFNKKDFNKYFPNWDFDVSDIMQPRWTGKVTTKLTDVLDHPELYESYPFLRSTKVEYDPAVHGAHAKVNENKIVFGSSNDFETALHEVQHLIQKQEGFAAGGSAAEAGKVYQLRWQKAFDQKKADVEKILKTYEETNVITAKEVDEVRKFQYIASRFEEYLKEANKEAYKNYMKLAGEVEARNVEARLFLDKFERRKSFPSSTEDAWSTNQVIVDQPAWATAYGVIDPVTGNVIKP